MAIHGAVSHSPTGIGSDAFLSVFFTVTSRALLRLPANGLTAPGGMVVFCFRFVPRGPFEFRFPPPGGQLPFRKIGHARPSDPVRNNVRFAILPSQQLVRFTIANELHFAGIEPQVSINSIRDIAEVA